jgi:signal transduction histidine kinase
MFSPVFFGVSLLLVGGALFFAGTLWQRRRALFRAGYGPVAAMRERDLCAFLETTPDTIARFDRAGQIVYSNPAFDCLILAPVKANPSRLGQGYLGGAHLQKMQQVLLSGVEDELECSWTDLTGEQVTSHIHLIPEFDAAAEINGVLSIGRDITAFKDTEHRLRESRSLLRELTTRHEREEERVRKAIAYEMHEEYGQSLSALRMSIVMLQMRFGATQPEIERQLAGARKLLDEVISKTRAMVSTIHPSVLDMGSGLALEWLADKYLSGKGIHYAVHVADTIGKMDETHTRLIYKISQIALANVVKHAAAQNVMLTLEANASGYRLEIRDDGVGFDLDRSKQASLGLVAMEELSNMLNGEIVFLSSPGKGTVIELCFPAAPSAQPAPLQSM